MRLKQAMVFVEEYLYRARGHRALEQSVYAAGERLGFSERTLARAGLMLGLDFSETGCWELPQARVDALSAERLHALVDHVPAPEPPPTLGGAAVPLA